MKRVLVAVLFSLSGISSTYAVSTTPQQPCCGEITAQGKKILDVLNAAQVETHWLANEHINWETGEPDRPADYTGPGRATHCSAFAAAIGKRLGVYMLRPPEHSQILLASAQTKWFASDAGKETGWQSVNNAQTAQALANQGKLVVISYSSPNPKKPGHIVIVRPSLKSIEQLNEQGPQITQAGQHNHTDWYAQAAFANHPGAWPSGVKYFAHDVDMMMANPSP